MIRYIIIFLLSVGLLSAQDDEVPVGLEVSVGDVLERGRLKSTQYRYIDFPKANFIIKKGGIADFKLLVGEKVKVVSIKEQRDGHTKIKIKRADGRRFFGSHALIGAEFEGAMESGELFVVK